MVLSAEEFDSVLCCADIPLHLNKPCYHCTENMQSVCIHNVETHVFYCYQNFIINGKTFLRITKFIPDFIQRQQELAFKDSSLWLSFPSGQSIFLNFSLVQSFLAAFLLRFSGSKAPQGLQKRTMIFGCFVFVLDFDSKHFKEAWGKRMLSLL